MFFLTPDEIYIYNKGILFFHLKYSLSMCARGDQLTNQRTTVVQGKQPENESTLPEALEYFCISFFISSAGNGVNA